MNEREGCKGQHEPMIDKEIAMLAYHYWEERGRPLGSADVDWYRATEEINRQLNSHIGPHSNPLPNISTRQA
jgi:hypothetical protein